MVATPAGAPPPLGFGPHAPPQSPMTQFDVMAVAVHVPESVAGSALAWRDESEHTSMASVTNAVLASRVVSIARGSFIRGCSRRGDVGSWLRALPEIAPIFPR